MISKTHYCTNPKMTQLKNPVSLPHLPVRPLKPRQGQARLGKASQGFFEKDCFLHAPERLLKSYSFPGLNPFYGDACTACAQRDNATYDGGIGIAIAARADGFCKGAFEIAGVMGSNPHAQGDRVRGRYQRAVSQGPDGIFNRKRDGHLAGQ
jgi:hypothetical protein